MGTSNMLKKKYPYPENLVLDILQADSPEAAWGERKPDDLPEAICLALSSLNEQEQIILLDRYQNHMTQAKIGEELSLSKNRVSQLEARTLRRLRGRYPAKCHLFTDGVTAYRQYLADIGAKRAAKAEEMKRPENIRVEDLCMPTRPVRCLLVAGYCYASELTGKDQKELMSLKGFGEKSYQYLQEALRKAGF